MEAPSHVVFGLAGAVVADSIWHLSGPPLLGAPLPADSHTLLDALLLKGIFYTTAALGALTPDIDNARSTIGKRAGFVSRGIQAIAGHRTIFHSLFGLFMVGLFVWGAQYALGFALSDLGFHRAAAALGVGSPAGIAPGTVRGVALIAFLLGYLLHIIADGLTLGGVPLFWPNPTRIGFPPERKWRFRTGSWREPLVVVAVAALVVVLLYFGTLRV